MDMGRYFQFPNVEIRCVRDGTWNTGKGVEMAVRLCIDTGVTYTNLNSIDDATGGRIVAKTPPHRPVQSMPS